MPHAPIASSPSQALQPGSHSVSPFRSCSLRALRLLVRFALFADDTAPGRGILLEHAAAEDTRSCEAVPRLVAALRASDCMRGVFDAVLAIALKEPAARYRGSSVSRLAEAWAKRPGTLAGPELAALLWCTARNNTAAFRPLEAKIALAASPDRLLADRWR